MAKILNGRNPSDSEDAVSNPAFKLAVKKVLAAIKAFGTSSARVVDGWFTTIRTEALQMTAGANKNRGTATLVAGTVTVANTSVKTGAQIILTGIGTTNAGILSQGTITNNVSFVISSSNASDARVVNYIIINPEA